jgi:hypothetical protein
MTSSIINGDNIHVFIYIYLFIHLFNYDIYHSGQGITIFSAPFMRMSHLRSPPWRGGHKALELPMAPRRGAVVPWLRSDPHGLTAKPLGAMVSLGWFKGNFTGNHGFYHQI